jgi:SAM-dependent methyltransferase
MEQLPLQAQQISAVAEPRRFWDARFGEDGFVYGEAPNDFLREQVQALPAGDALCLAEGEGRNGVFLAECGHRVIVQDISPVGLAKAERLASQRGVSITTRCSDLNDDDLAVGGVDLVVAIWMHLPPSLRTRVHRRMVQVLRPGGTLILEAYTPRQLALGTGGPPLLELLIEPEELRQELVGLELLILEETRRSIAEGPYHHGDSAVVRVLARRPIVEADG